ncbi:hypothetical protein BC938DRAFT_472811 [Jimgerdemannia flammicorona]|uniref:FAD-binding FR-type domain-containing protein n=1 Tax=Jimgerdemannia flammicorona TaxID=994334 RepID=A0A433QTU2_9FUNG|nr:hypothetical protein BC938DRAFT_472811 [Jimgerdemannia flammicorona]
MNPILLKYLEEVAKVKAEVAAKQEKREQDLLKKKFAKPVGIYYEDGEPCLNLPDSPEKPDQSDCCNNGCTPCVFDVYSGELRDHQELVEQLKLDFESCCFSRDGSDTSSVASERLQRLAAADDRPLTSKAYRPFRVEEIHHVSAKLVVVDETERALGVKDGEHVLLSYMGNIITKAFTPISHPDTKGTFKIMIKSYPNTAMSKYFRSLSIGDSIHLRGPIHSGYSYVPNTVIIITMFAFLIVLIAARLIMLAAGSGIAPMYQILMKLRDHRSDDMTRLDLVYSNSTEEDVWLREELEILAKELDVLRVYHVITRVSFDSGFV